VLLAEDNATNQKLAMHLLGKMGCRVDVAANGREAVELAGQLPYDVIFMDCQMPEMDGFQATREIRRQEADASQIARPGARRPGWRVPILAVTASAMASDRTACVDAGMDDFISKPFHPEDLRQALNRWCGRGVRAP
jgi:CheY-like chemotaxis protein